VTKPFYITTPIYYVNDRPHIGHSYTTIAADLLARFHRLAGRETFFLTGTDEHGNKVAEAAEKAKQEPQKFCDGVVEHFKNAWKNLDIEYNDFIRTTDKRHEKALHKILNILYKSKTADGQPVIYPDVYEGLYCTGCEKFLTDKELVDGVCPDHKVPPQLVKEKNYFFRLNAYLPKLKGLIESNELEILPEERRREVLGLIGQGLSDFSLSREKVKWGIPLPFDKSQVAYVWVDALFNYLSGIGYGADQAKFRKWWFDADVIHLMAKDILKFHCLFWPAMLMAADLPLPKTIYLHGFFTVDGEKMSKSLGNQIAPGELVEEFGVDATRYLLLTQYPFGADGDIRRSRFSSKYNSDLANDLGNLVSRVAKMIVANFDSKLPEPTKNVNGMQELVSTAETLPERVIDNINNFRIGSAIDECMNMVRDTNRFFDGNAPWQLVKSDNKEKAGGVLYLCCEIIRIVATLLYPVMPNKSMEMLSVLGVDKEALSLANARVFFYLKPGSLVRIEQPVFPRLSGKEKVAAVAKQATVPDNLLDISEFAKLKMVVAEVITAEKVEGTDKLLKLRINIGSEERQIVAGIAEHYTPDDMIGRKIIVIKNLKPARIRGIDSNGMLLAAHKGKKLTLVVPDSDLPSGSAIS
jgi:methionyl-tRNA synthetase